MNTAHETKEYGPHEFDDSDTSYCKHGCGCWIGMYRSGGPTSVDHDGECPNNPKDGVRLGKEDDIEVVVYRRIVRLENELRKAKHLLKAVEPDKLTLAEELTRTKQALLNAEERIKGLIKQS